MKSIKNEKLEYQDKTVIITGGASGIGRGLAEFYLKQGARVYITYNVSEDGLNELKSKWKNQIIGVKVNNKNTEEIERFMSNFECIDILINNAGITRDQLAIFMTVEEWQSVLDVNLTGTFLYCKYALLKMIQKKSGNIVNISSLSGIKGIKGQVNYAASKGGVISLTKVLSREVARKNIRVNAVAPGFIKTAMLEKLDSHKQSEIHEEIPMRRIGTIQEVVSVVEFLTSARSSYITGQCIVVDGGLSV